MSYLYQEHQFTTAKWLRTVFTHLAHASEAKLSVLADDPSASDGFDSCFAAAWRTRSWTAVVDGDVARPILFGSSFLAAHESASAPTLTGESNSLHKGTVRVRENLCLKFEQWLNCKLMEWKHAHETQMLPARGNLL